MSGKSPLQPLPLSDQTVSETAEPFTVSDVPPTAMTSLSEAGK